MEKLAAVLKTRRLLKVLVVLWACALSLVAATLMAGHWVTLPKPATDDPRVRMALAELQTESDAWLALHVLYAKCRCSRRVFQHLFESERPQNVEERVLLVGHHAEYEAKARARGFALEVLTPAALKERYQLEAAPLFVVLNPAGDIRYLGGYTDRKQGYDIRDLSILEGLQKGEVKGALPLFGCAVSRQLQALMDPLRVKYSEPDS